MELLGWFNPDSDALVACQRNQWSMARLPTLPTKTETQSYAPTRGFVLYKSLAWSTVYTPQLSHVEPQLSRNIVEEYRRSEGPNASMSIETPNIYFRLAKSLFWGTYTLAMTSRQIHVPLQPFASSMANASQRT